MERDFFFIGNKEKQKGKKKYIFCIVLVLGNEKLASRLKKITSLSTFSVFIARKLK